MKMVGDLPGESQQQCRELDPIDTRLELTCEISLAQSEGRRRQNAVEWGSGYRGGRRALRREE